jgi:hypothetical protein
MLAVSRAVLGIGVGGKYPLASVMRAKIAEAVKLNTNRDKADHRAQRSGTIVPLADPWGHFAVCFLGYFTVAYGRAK